MCSGADPDLLAESPKSEQIKYAGVGGTVFFTAVMAFIASAYALFTVFDSIWASLFFGLVWGLLIFNLDRFIVSSMKKRESKTAEIMQALPRIVLAMIIAMVISKPLELKLFEKEIDQVLLSQKNNMTLANQDQIAMIYSKEKEEIMNRINSLDRSIAEKEGEVNRLYDTYIAEAEGREGTKLIGKGPVYKEKREKHDLMLGELQAMKEQSAAEQVTLKNRYSSLEDLEKQQVADSQPIIDGFDGLMARVDALGELPWLPSFFIFLLFLAVETAPVLAKLMTPKGSYDIKMADAEEAVQIWATQKSRQRRSLLDADTALNRKVYQSIAEEDETYHYKKQQARGLIRFQTDSFVDEQKGLAAGTT